MLTLLILSAMGIRLRAGCRHVSPVRPACRRGRIKIATLYILVEPCGAPRLVCVNWNKLNANCLHRGKN